jgi:hypothetical protein
MKKKIIISVVALMLFAFSIAAYAYTATNHSTAKTSCPMTDCCKDGVCKMHGECCKDTDSCPLKSKEMSGEMKDCPMHKGK